MRRVLPAKAARNSRDAGPTSAGAARIVRAADLGVVDAQLGPLQLGLRQRLERAELPPAGRVALLHQAQRARERDRVQPLFGREVGVARRQRQAVRLAHDRTADHLGGEIEIARHAADDGELLEVLLAEEGQLRARQGEELGDHRAHAAEMAGAARAAERLGERARLDPGLEAGRIELLGRARGEDEARAGLLALLEIAVEVARVAGEILAGPELGRVDEDGDRHRGRALRGELDQRLVPAVEEPHRRHQPEHAVAPGLGAEIPELARALDQRDAHRRGSGIE